MNSVQFAHVVDRADVGMIDGGGRPRLADKPIEDFLLAGLGEEWNLQCHLTIENSVLCQKDLPHRAGTKFLEDVVASEIASRLQKLVRCL